MKTLKIIALGLFMLTGYGFRTYGQLFSSHDVLPAYQRAEQQKIVYRVADSCLSAAEKLEARKIAYRPKDYFQAIKAINLTAKKYNLAVPVYAIKALKTIMCRGRDFIPEDIKSEITKAWSAVEPHKSLNLTYWLHCLWQGAIFIAYILISLLLLHFSLRVLPLLIIKAVTFVRKAIISFKVLRQDYQLIVFELETKKLFWYQARAPSGYHPDIAKVPWIY